jgi:protection-of-telomeres protein 1
MRAGAVGLIANKFSTQFHIIAASKIRSGSRVMPGDWQVFTLKPNATPPNPLELAYVTWATSRSSLMGLPTEAEFQEKLAQSGNVKDKFSLLKDVKPDCFYNILGEVSKIKDSGQDIITVCLSDYTANPNFYNYVWRGEVEEAQERRGDEYGYTKFSEMGDREWTGPFGRLTIHLNLFDGHAQFVRESVKTGNWVLFTNVKMGFGKMGGFLEGYLRVDQWAYEGKVQVKVMTTSDNPEDIDPRWKEALRRKVEWQKKYALQLQSIRDEAAGLPKKRKSRQHDLSKGNSKERRKERRAAAEKKAGMNLNENSKLISSIAILAYVCSKMQFPR